MINEQDKPIITPHTDCFEKIKQTRDSYIKKEDFINMIQNLKFDTIKEVRIVFNTSYEFIPETKNEKEHIKTYGFILDID